MPGTGRYLQIVNPLCLTLTFSAPIADFQVSIYILELLKIRDKNLGNNCKIQWT